MDARETRLAQNEAIYREVNERIQGMAEQLSHGDDTHTFMYFCECSNTDCFLQIPLSVREYESVRADATRFVVATGHELPEIETIVKREPAYSVVEKRGDAAELVEALDPRGDGG